MSLPGFLAERGAIPGRVDDLVVPRHFGDPAGEYEAARTSAGIVFRPDRRLLRIHGRAPRQMLHGILTSAISEPPEPSPEAVASVRYGALLTPKGRMVTDLKQVWLGASEEEGLGLDLPAAGLEGALAHFQRYLPPRFARAESLNAGMALVTVVGPLAEPVVGAVGSAPPGGEFALLEGGPLGGGALLAGGVEQVGPSWDLWIHRDSLEALWAELESAGGRPVGWGVWETLRVEEGYPRFGIDMTESTIPIEAGLGERAFDHGKGCYTGQEVIVRIRHRGHVNWHLRALRFGAARPREGDELYGPEGTKVLGRITSVVESPRFGQVIGLGYVRREMEPPTALRLGGSDGPEVRVEALPR